MRDIVSETKTTALTGSQLANATTAARLLKKTIISQVIGHVNNLSSSSMIGFFYINDL